MKVEDKKLNGDIIPIGQLLSQENFFRVPEYQRPFSWEMDNFDDLISDIIDAKKDQEYFLGTVVLHHQKIKGHYDIVDGQQRLTSMMILFACLRDLVQDKKYSTGLQEKIVQQENVVDGIPEKIRLEVKDRQIFNEIVITPGGTKIDRRAADLSEPANRYVEAVNVFKSKLESLGIKDINELITFLSQKCIVIYLATPTFEDAFRLFTIVNDRGKQLRRIDILKAINISPDVITKDTVRDRIAQDWEDLERDLGESNFEELFHFIRLIILKDKPQGDLLKEFEERIFKRSLMTRGESFFDRVFKFAKIYQKIFQDRDIVPENDPNHLKYRALIHIMDNEFRASEWRACLLAFAEKFGGTKFYNFCLKLEKVFLDHWVQGVRKDERYSTYAKILILIETSKTPNDAIKRIEFDEAAIKEAAGGENIYKAGYRKYFLLRLEIVAAEHDSVREFSAKSIEHVLPQNPAIDSDWAKHNDLSRIDEYVNSLGNLVLLSKGKNSAAGNFDFEKKKEKYLAPRVSDYPRSVQILKLKKWDESIIKKRTKEAQELILSDP